MYWIWFEKIRDVKVVGFLELVDFYVDPNKNPDWVDFKKFLFNIWLDLIGLKRSLGLRYSNIYLTYCCLNIKD